MKEKIIHRQVDDYYFLHCYKDSDGYHAEIGVYTEKELIDEHFVGVAFGHGETLELAIENARQNIHPDYATSIINWR
jgi:hypothetical protein